MRIGQKYRHFTVETSSSDYHLSKSTQVIKTNSYQSTVIEILLKLRRKSESILFRSKNQLLQTEHVSYSSPVYTWCIKGYVNPYTFSVKISGHPINKVKLSYRILGYQN